MFLSQLRRGGGGQLSLWKASWTLFFQVIRSAWHSPSAPSQHQLLSNYIPHKEIKEKSNHPAYVDPSPLVLFTCAFATVTIRRKDIVTCSATKLWLDDDTTKIWPYASNATFTYYVNSLSVIEGTGGHRFTEPFLLILEYRRVLKN